MSLIGTAILAFVSIIVPGFFLALGLLKKTKLSLFEITAIGFIFGLIFPPALTWTEAYLIPYIHAFSFSAGLYNANVLLLTIIGIAISFQQGAISFDFLKAKSSSEIIADMHKDYKERLADLRKTISSLNMDMSLIKEHEIEERSLAQRHSQEAQRLSEAGPEERKKVLEMHSAEEKKLIEQHEAEERMLLHGKKKSEKKGNSLIWTILLAIMLLTFATRLMNIGTAPKFFEFDPYYDLLSTESILTHGSQWLFDHSAWPTVVNGTVHRIEPLMPYLEAYWYQISNPPTNAISTSLMSYTSSFYPPIVAALLVFIVFMFLYHSFGEYPAIIGAALAAAMPALITTFIAGEQLLEPWGIFSMFFFYMAYLLAVQNPKEIRFAILAGIAFASTFLGAHYYTVDAGVLAAYILLQGVVSVIRKEDMKDFYRMNIVVLAIIVVFFLLFDPYGSVLANAVPEVLGIPVIVSFPLLALIAVAAGELAVNYLAPRIEKSTGKTLSRVTVWAVILIVIVLLVLLTPIGNPIDRYLALSSHYTTPSTALFMTVQEYEPTGFNYNFGPVGFGIIGSSILGVNLIVWFVLLLFTALAFWAVYKRNSKGSILAIAAIWPLAIAGMIEVKYLPHFGVGYIIAIGIILGEFMLLAGDWKRTAWLAILAFGIFIVLLESFSFVSIFSAAGQTCNTIGSQGNSIGFNLFCNVVPNYWLQATTWMRNNVGPFAPRILSWWDYGDWINWFGNSNAVLRGDNSVAGLDYATAARYVLGSKDGFGPANLTQFADSVQAKYVLFDDQLTQKWQALDFLGCVYTNQTSRSYAIQAAVAANASAPYLLGTSQCELDHDPVYVYMPAQTNNLGSYCQMPNKTEVALKTILTIGNAELLTTNATYCIPGTFMSSLLNGVPPPPVRLLYQNGTVTNILVVPSAQFYLGPVNLGTSQNPNVYLDFMVLYLPNGPNNTITNAPTEFYNSNYYRGFYLGSLPGFKIAYPSNFTGINYVNGTHPVVIYQLNNYTGSLPYVTPKPAWINNNFTMPG